MSGGARGPLRDHLGVASLTLLGVVVVTMVWARAVVLPERNMVTADALDDGGRGRSLVLVVGVDRRPDSGSRSGSMGRFSGTRADALVLVAVGDHDRLMAVSLPRDLRARAPGYGDQRLSGFRAYGSDVLVDAARSALDVPVHHYVEVDMEGFASIVDSVGGVEMTFPWPARDTVTGFSTAAGRHRLDGHAALAYVRARRYEEHRAAGWVAVGPDDRGRTQRQHQIIDALTATVQHLGMRRRAHLLHIVGRHVTVDAELGMVAMLRMLAVAADAEWNLAVLPVRRAVPRAEALSPFPPVRWGTTTTLVRAEPAATQLLTTLCAQGHSAAATRRP